MLLHSAPACPSALTFQTASLQTLKINKPTRGLLYSFTTPEKQSWAVPVSWKMRLTDRETEASESDSVKRSAVAKAHYAGGLARRFGQMTAHDVLCGACPLR